jgi:diacylglycerol kinase family enzyme
MEAGEDVRRAVEGTRSSMVDLFAGRDVVLGLLPPGTANSFTRGLNLPLSLEDAVEVIASGRVANVDLARVGDDYFVTPPFWAFRPWSPGPRRMP